MFENGTFHFLNLQYIFYRIYTLFVGEPTIPGVEGGVSGSTGAGGLFSSPMLQEFFVLLSIFAVFLTILFFCMALYAAVRLHEVLQKNKFVLPIAPPDASRPPKRDQWEEVLKHVSSENPSDWKLAVLEADGILDELTFALKLPGDTLGERLKNAVPGDFKTLNDAWEGHKVRNQVAHEGLSFVLTKREARAAIEHFERVFKEFKLI